MMRKSILAMIICLLVMTGCSESEVSDVSLESNIQASESDTIQTDNSEYVWYPSENDQQIADFLRTYLSDPEENPDLEDYQYYAIAIGQDKNCLLDPAMWEAFYSEDINRNKDINGLDIYLIRLNPYKLLDIYAENNSCSVDELCKQMSVSKEQLYYNWGYNPASIDYYDNHIEDIVEYSEEEQKIFGIYNTECRSTVMQTHLLILDHNEQTINYISSMMEPYEIKRRDLLNSNSSDAKLYSQFTEEEKNPAYRINGIGIRSIIPLSIPNAYTYAAETGLGDERITVMINKSPFAYGCTDDDKIDLEAIYNYINKES